MQSIAKKIFFFFQKEENLFVLLVFTFSIQNKKHIIMRQFFVCNIRIFNSNNL